MIRNHNERHIYNYCYPVRESRPTYRDTKKTVRASQFYENIDVTGLILKTITELQRRKQKDNTRLYHPPREDQTELYFYILPKTGSVFKVKCVNIGYSIGKCFKEGITMNWKLS